MKKTYLSNYFVCAVVGGTLFWACFGIVIFITGSKLSGKSVRFLTLLTPIVTWIILRIWYNTILPHGKRGIMPSIVIGVFGPLIMTWLYSLIMISIPSVQIGPPLDTVKDYFEYIGLSLTIVPLSVLTYTGMLGAMVLNIISSPIMGWWLSKHFGR
jgi:hypothetical protein